MEDFDLSSWQDFNINQPSQNPVHIQPAMLHFANTEEHSNRLPASILLEVQPQNGQRNDVVKIRIKIEVCMMNNHARVMSCEIMN